MKKAILILVTFLAFGIKIATAQIVGVGHASQGSTNYTNGASNDTIYFWCGAAATGTLTATPPGGVPGWNFVWQVFNPATNSWNPFTVQNGVPTSTISGLAGGLYRVTITDGTSAVVGCYRAWVSIVTNPTTVDVAPIPPGCGAVQLNGTINYGSATQLYNPPADPFLVSSTTQITVCFTGTHTWVSDLAFYLVGPASCGSPTVLLSPNPGALMQNSVCNSGDNFTNLCFTTNPAGNLNVCNPAPSTLSGTYSSYGPANTPINWSTIFGCDATQGGWRVQVYDCIPADVGALQNATITFTGTTICGQSSTMTYNSGAINSPINDQSCSAGTASIFTVTPTAATTINYPGSYIWTANPPIAIPNATSSLNPLVNPGPTQNTTFTLTLVGGAIPTCGGNNSDSELYIYTPPQFPTISPVPPVCINDGPFALTANIPGGTWAGPGIIDPVNGIFDPSVAGAGNAVVTYSFTGPCGGGDSETIVVNNMSNATISAAGPFCTTDPATTLTAASPGGTWSGTGITNASTGAFNPALVTSGSTTITYTIPGACGNTDTETIIVNSANPVINPVSPQCVNGSPITLTANTAGTWSGNGITNASTGTFDPAIAGAGTHVITLTVGSPCPGSTTVTITVNNAPTANAGNNSSFCAGGSGVQLNATGGAGYSWSPATGLSSTTVANPTATPAATTVYTVTVTGANGCTNTSSVTVTVNPLPTVTLPSSVTICQGASTVLNVTGTASSFSWTPAGGLSSSTSANPTANPSGTTVYTVTGTDANGCTNTASVTVNVSSITATATATPSSGTEPLDVEFTNTTVGGTNFFWDYGNGDSETTAGTVTNTTYLTDSTYTVTMVATNADGCIDTLVLTISVFDAYALLIPNVFSPNGDGSNDEFRIVATGIQNMSMTLFNRWGKELISFTDVNFRWDGKINGKEAAEGTYYYIFKAEKMDGTPVEQTGTVTLMKQ